MFASAVDILNTLSAAQRTGRLKFEMIQYLNPPDCESTNSVISPLDKTGAGLLFLIISHRYEKGSIILTTNCVFKHWPEIFNNEAPLPP